MIKNILVPIDGSDHAKAAVQYGLWLAERFDGNLIGQHVIDTVSIEGSFFHDISGSMGFEPYLDFSTKMREVLEERGKFILEEFSRLCTARGVRHETVLDMGIVPNEICERAKLADLVVLGHRGINEEFSTGLLGGTAESVTRKSPRPVFVSTKTFKEVERPLLAYDGSQRASAAMEMAAELCSRLKIPLTVLYVAKRDDSGERVLQEARAYLGAYEIETRYELAQGYPEEKILDYLVNFHYDLLFIGAYGHRRIIEMVLGSTTEYLLRKSPCPVFLNR
ncbi:MAG TPA: universal stress protein [Candidatus Acidoferrales bacterium]|nr:universal stress protein [Candidatus Acidoferrales bacterium]